MASFDDAHGDAFPRFVAALESAGRSVETRGDGASAMAQCPAHLDENPSLSITDAGDRVLIHCHAGCEAEDIVDALGLTTAELFNTAESEAAVTAQPTAVTQYNYVDETGAPLSCVVRYDPKTFRQYRWNGNSWESTLGDARRVLYRLPDLLAGMAAGQWIFVVEGEKDAERLAAKGFTATTIPGGANHGNWDKTETSVLDDAYVAVIGDNDATGRKYARHVAKSLTGRAAAVRFVRLEGLPEKGDVSDWFDAGGTPKEFASVVEATREWRGPQPKFDGAEPFLTVGNIAAFRADHLRLWAQKASEWRVRGVLVRGTHLVVGASKKTLKTTLVSCEMAFAVANGRPWLDHDAFEVEAQTPVVVVINEGLKSYMRSLHRIAARYGVESFGPIYVIDASGYNLNDNDLVEAIREAIEESGAGMVIYDAWYGFVGGDVEASSLFAMREVFGIVQGLADELGVDPVVVHHLKKNSKGKPDLDDLAFAGVAEWADSWLLLTHREPPRPDEGEYRLGLIAGSRQWGELTYEVDGSFGRVDVEHGGYTESPRWTVTRVDSERSDKWGGKGAESAIESQTSLLDFIVADPYEYTKSSLCKAAPGSDQNNRAALKRLIDDGTVTVVKRKRSEGNRSVTRDLIGPSGVDPADVEQGRLVPIGEDQPTNVAQQGAGNSTGAAVSAPSEPPAQTNLGHATDVENPGAATVSAPTLVSADVPDRGSGSVRSPAETVVPPSPRTPPEPPSTEDPLCRRCDAPHQRTPPGGINWHCYARALHLDPLGVA